MPRRYLTGIEHSNLFPEEEIMRELTLRYATLDRFGSCPPLGGLSVAAFVDPHLDMRSFFVARESESADEGEHDWIDLGGEG